MGKIPVITTEDDHPLPRLIWARACDPISFNGLAAESYHHDHDEELGMYWYPELHSRRQRTRDLAYWIETGRLIREYLELQVGSGYNDTLRQGFIEWLQRSPEERRQYMDGDDMQRAALVDWFLKITR